ncbi:hypothetical protein OROGR_025876 [Orobanche gracilis]
MEQEDNGMFNVTQTIGSVLCCKCGILMQPNAANMCAKCLRSEIDITEGLQKQATVIHCPECDCYLHPPRTWIKAQLESKELLTFCVKKLKNLNTVRVVHAEFIWTEPHSRRIKVKLNVQKEVLNGAILEQAFTAEYTVQDQLCKSCSRVQANPDQWEASVQLRQHVSHRRTFFYLQVDRGIDFFFGKRSHGLKFVDFVGKVAPVKTRNDKQIVSQDMKSNNYNYKFTFSVEISPICREDLICLPPKVALGLGNFGPLVICNKVTNCISLLDPFTLGQKFLDSNQYWRSSFKALLSSKQLVEYVVLDVEPVSNDVNIGGLKYVLADAQVARVSDFGKNDTIFNVRTHLGRLLNPGDYALGYDLFGANTNDIEMDKYKGLDLPSVVLIKETQVLNMEVDTSDRVRDGGEKVASEYEEFKRDIEENPDLRFNLSLYRDENYQPSEVASATDGEDAPTVPLDELLDDLHLSDDQVGDEDMRE